MIYLPLVAPSYVVNCYQMQKVAGKKLSDPQTCSIYQLNSGCLKMRNLEKTYDSSLLSFVYCTVAFRFLLENEKKSFEYIYDIFQLFKNYICFTRSQTFKSDQMNSHRFDNKIKSSNLLR